MRTSSGEKFLWLLAGAGLGAGLTFLFATKAGRKFRRQVLRYAEDTGERIVESGQEVLGKGKKAYERGKEVVDEAMEYIDRGRRAVMR
ncbi:MAG: YtxH domain-containing protein [Acidobacteria bacterium]|nr:YtxH domain-containing protein [Acidobacteriota bacterium]